MEKKAQQSNSPETDAAWAAWTYAGPGVHANFARKLERERDQLRAELAGWKSGVVSRPCEHAVTMLDFAQQTAEANQRANELRAEVERLKADKARLDWLGRRHYTGLTPSLLDEELPAFISPQSTKSPYIRDAIDAAMKGAE